MKLIYGSALNTYEEQERLFNKYAEELIEKYGKDKTDTSDKCILDNRSIANEGIL